MGVLVQRGVASFLFGSCTWYFEHYLILMAWNHTMLLGGLVLSLKTPEDSYDLC